MSLITVADLTFEPEQAKALADVIKERSFSNKELTYLHTIIEPIEAKKKIPYLGHFGLLGKAAPANCDPVPQEANIPGSEKEWDPEEALLYVTQCYKPLMESFWVYAMNKGIKRPDLTGTDFELFVSERFGEAQLEAILRWIWFGDRDAETYNGTPAGQLTNGTEEDYWTLIDGFWKQIFAIVAADSARRITIAQNDEATYAAQAFDATDTTNKVATEIFAQLITGSDFRMRDQKGNRIIATQSLVDQYARELRSVGVDASFERIEAGYRTLQFEGVEIVAFPFWDRMIRTYFDSGTKWHLPHRALFIDRSNLVVGTDAVKGLAEAEVFYDKVKELNHWKSRFMLDAKIVEDKMIQVAY